MHEFEPDLTFISGRQVVRDYTYPIEKYLDQLVRELEIYGMPLEDIPLFRAECRSHLDEVFSYSQPSTVDEIDLVLRQFGSAKSLAKRLVAEHQRVRSTWRAFRWPAVAIGLTYLLGVMQALLPFFPIIFLLFFVGPLLLFVAGFVARQFFRVQLVAVFALFVFCSFFLSACLCYPAPSHPSKFVSRGQTPKLLSQLQRERARGLELIQNNNDASLAIRMARTIDEVPAKYLINGKVILPAGLEMRFFEGNSIPPEGVTARSLSEAK